MYKSSELTILVMPQITPSHANQEFIKYDRVSLSGSTGPVKKKKKHAYWRFPTAEQEL